MGTGRLPTSDSDSGRGRRAPSGRGRARKRPALGRPAAGATATRETARTVALAVLRRVTEHGAYSNLALAAALQSTALDERDRRLVTELTYGTLRHLPALDRALAAASTRALEDVDDEPLAVLRLGAHQILFTRIPAHAAVAETVSLARARHRAFANAVLRRLAAAGMPTQPAGDSDDAVSARTGLSAWAVAELRRLLSAYEVEPAAAALAAPADLCLRTNTCKTSPEKLEATLRDAGHDVRRARHHPDALVVRAAAPARLPGYREGWFTIQDEASVLVASAVGAEPGQRILDACAGPGGKAAHLACLVQPGGLLVAGDRSRARAALVRSTADRLGLPIRVLVQDATHPALLPEFDAALVDAPCSGLGAARRRPELLWRPSKDKLSGLARLQVDLLLGVADLVRPGGSLVYAVCTFPRAETDAAVRAFLSKRLDFEPKEVPGPDGPSASHRLWPHRHGTDAMFYAGFRRRAWQGR